MASPRSTLQIVKYLHRDPVRSRSNSIVEIDQEDGRQLRYVRDYSANVGAGNYGEVYRLTLETDSSQHILAKKEKQKENGLFVEGNDMLKEAKNWVKAEGFGGYVGDPKATDKPHIIIMPDLITNEKTMPLKNVRYDSIQDFLAMMWFILGEIDTFHQEKQLIHFDISENNILYDETNRTLKFVDLGLARDNGEEVHRNVYNAKCHSGQNSGYFPPELNPNKSAKLDKIAKPAHDTYLAGRMLSRMINNSALDRSGKKLVFPSSIENVFKTITDAMQAPADSRTDLSDAINKMAQLTRLCQLLERQDSLSHIDDTIMELVDSLRETIFEPTIEIPQLTKHFKPEHQATLSQLLKEQQATFKLSF